MLDNFAPRRALPSPELLRQLLRYEPETGDMFWRPRTPDMFQSSARSADWQCKAWNAKRADTPALSHINDSGYKRGNIGGVSVRAHRAAWAIVHGRWPEHEIDHVNGDPLDNRLTNLREATSGENKTNRGAYSKTSPYIGVSPNGSRWAAGVRAKGKYHYGGSFRTQEDAAKSRDQLAKQLHGEYARLNFPSD